jgi:hypothetical protein
MVEAMAVLLLVIGVFYVCVLGKLVNVSHQCEELWQAWEELGRKEALAGRGPMNVPTGEAHQAYLKGWQQVFTEKALEDNVTQ